eukprot:351483-Chlamydomonas_euryale.AAC.5
MACWLSCMACWPGGGGRGRGGPPRSFEPASRGSVAASLGAPIPGRSASPLDPNETTPSFTASPASISSSMSSSKTSLAYPSATPATAVAASSAGGCDAVATCAEAFGVEPGSGASWAAASGNGMSFECPSSSEFAAVAAGAPVPGKSASPLDLNQTMPSSSTPPPISTSSPMSSPMSSSKLPSTAYSSEGSAETAASTRSRAAAAGGRCSAPAL